MQLSVSVTQDDVGALVPSPMGHGVAYVTINHNDSPKSAIISFAGINQAVATFDDFGTRALTYNLLNPGACMVIQRSVENIIEHMNNNMLG
jgi:hypothetical protein